MLKKVISVTLTLVLLFSLVACSNNGNKSDGAVAWPKSEIFSKIPKLQKKVDFYEVADNKDGLGEVETISLKDLSYKDFKVYTDTFREKGYIFSNMVPETFPAGSIMFTTVLNKDGVWVKMKWWDREEYSGIVMAELDYNFTMSLYTVDPNTASQ